MLPTVVSVHIYIVAALVGIALLTILHLLTCCVFRRYCSGGCVPNGGSLPTHVTHSQTGAGDLGALDFQIFSAPVCTTVSVDCDPN